MQTERCSMREAWHVRHASSRLTNQSLSRRSFDLSELVDHGLNECAVVRFFAQILRALLRPVSRSVAAAGGLARPLRLAETRGALPSRQRRSRAAHSRPAAPSSRCFQSGGWSSHGRVGQSLKALPLFTEDQRFEFLSPPAEMVWGRRRGDGTIVAAGN